MWLVWWGLACHDPVAEPAGPNDAVATAPDWAARVDHRIRDGALAFAPHRDGLRAVRPDGLGVHVRAEGATLDTDRARIRLGATTLGRAALEATIGGAPRLDACVGDLEDPTGACVRRVAIDADDVTTWWAPRRDGFQQGWEVARAPDGDDPLTLGVPVAGAEVVAVGDDVHLVPDVGAPVAVAGLDAWDADGYALPAWFEVVDDGFLVRVDDTDARYPIAVDPVYTILGWSAGPTATNAALGTRLAAVGDVDGDGYEDLLAAGASTTSGLYLYLGGSALSDFPDQTIAKGSDDAGFGQMFAAAGDVDADGYDDVVIRVTSATSTTVRKVYLYRGSSSGLRTTATTTLTGTTTEDFGHLFGPADFNGDGYGDVAVGAPSASSSYGKIYIYSGSATGALSLAATLTGPSTATATFGSRVAVGLDLENDGYDDLVASTSTPTVYVYKGGSTSLTTAAYRSFSGTHTSATPFTVGDVTGDGYDDLALGTPSETGTYTSGGRVRLYKGSSSGLNTTVVTTLTSGAASADFGGSVAGGNWNRDAYNDVVVGSSTRSSAGAAYVYPGTSTGLSTGLTTLTGVSGTFGKQVAMADLDGDGDDEVVVAAPTYGGTSGPGQVLVYPGATSTSSSAGTALYGWQSVAYGTSVAGLGDVDDDGYGDFAVGAPGSTYTIPGRVYVYYGAADGPDTVAGTELEPASGKTSFGALVAGLGDTNGDGYADLGVLQQSTEIAVFHGASAGLSTTVAKTLAIGSTTTFGPAGDIENDGYDDVLVGAYGATKASVYKGSATGVATTAAVTITGTGSYGRAVAGLGDVNGDGYGDVAIADPSYSTNRGAVYVYHGASTGLATTVKTTLTGSTTSIYLGWAVGAAGDVNNDGYDDLVVGSNSTVAAVYAGSSTGIATTGRALSVTTGLTAVGATVAGGDFDGDGYSDVAIGANNDRVYLYNGASTGITTTAAQTLSAVEASSFFGTGLAGVPDVDGDGFDEVLVGARSASSGMGDAYLYQGTGDKDGDGYTTPTDCDDRDASIHPGGTEICDEASHDEDCDGLVDDADASVSTAGFLQFYVDADADGYGAGSRTGTASCDPVAGYSKLSTDCNDANALISPSATEICDAADVDEDCDGSADDADASTSTASKTSYYSDGDGDGYGATKIGAACTIPSPYVGPSGDCNDADAAISPAATEKCDASNVDEDCDGVADDKDTSPSGTTSFYRDVDGDGYGIATATPFCDRPTGYATVGTDCDDTLATTNPAGTEVCGGADEDCDTLVDDADSSTADSGKTTYYVDSDGDGFGGTSKRACVIATGLSAIDGDCDDAAKATHPGGTEICDAADADEDCDGASDDDDPTVAASGKTRGYEDADSDGHGGVVSATWCDLPTGWTSTSTDCDDTDGTISPDATEACDAANTDEDCDGLADDADPTVSTASLKTFYRDIDRDGYGTPTSPTSACDASTGVVTNDDDCDDKNDDIHPAGVEHVADGVDGDCDGRDTCYVDADGDGYRDVEQTTVIGTVGCTGAGEALASVPATDCHDGNAGVSPAATERTGDEFDQDCDGRELCFADLDDDGYRADGDATVTSDDADCRDAGEATSKEPTGDCNDAYAAFHPYAEEFCEDAADYNCDGQAGNFDNDGDGYAACAECDDDDDTRSPGTPETCNGIDDDCDGAIDDEATDAPAWQRDADGDGYTFADDEVRACEAPNGYIAPNPGDCDDAAADVHPGADDLVDDSDDQDCDGTPKTGVQCGCASGGSSGWAGALGALVVVARRRRAR